MTAVDRGSPAVRLTERLRLEPIGSFSRSWSGLRLCWLGRGARLSDAAVVAPAGPWLIDDLDRLPDGPSRYEIVDGSLLMSPPPSARHQGVAGLVATHEAIWGAAATVAARDVVLVVEIVSRSSMTMDRMAGQLRP